MSSNVTLTKSHASTERCLETNFGEIISDLEKKNVAEAASCVLYASFYLAFGSFIALGIPLCWEEQSLKSRK